MAGEDPTLDNFSKRCPSDRQLSELLAGSLEALPLELIEAHLSHCLPCQDRLEDIANSASPSPNWATRQAGLDPVNLDRAEQHVSADSCPTCGGPRHEGLHAAPTKTWSTQELASHQGEGSFGPDTVQRVARLEKELPTIPGYECEALLGRGGMGVVYRARQVALNRPVALKMIVTGRHASLQQLARFHIEAEALACLTHENIVQIYEFGEHASGPYLALELIDGESLDSQLKRQPLTPREAAELCRKLARAMHLAHSRGVVHRDLKPANILMTKAGQPKITDFGLAKRLSENSQWTKTDTVMGTPHYMAPEQAAGDSHAVGPLADVYSLGTIFYELLTGKPPFTAGNMAELLGQICSEPPKPIRKTHPQVPKDLETICLRCLEKEPEKRYETLDDLADDLERFLEGRPIQARPVGWIERIVKWGKRRPAVAMLLTGLVLLMVVIATGGVFYSMRLKQERDLVESNFQLATAAVDQFLTNLGEENFLTEPHFEERRRELLQTALTYTQQLAEQDPENPAMQRNIGFCHRRLGDIYRLMRKHDLAKPAYQKAIFILTGVHKENPDDVAVTLQLAEAHGFLAELERVNSEVDEARASFAAASTLFEHLLQTQPDSAVCRAEFARMLYNLGILQKETAGAANDPNREVNLNLARQSLNASIALLVPLQEQAPTNRDFAQHLARSYINLGSVMRLQQAPRKARVPYQNAIRLLEELHRRFPTIAEYQDELAKAHNNLGNLLTGAGEHREAILEYESAEKLFSRLVEDHHKFPDFRRSLANTYNSLAVAYYRLKDNTQTQAAWEKSLEQLEILVQTFPDVPDYHGVLGTNLTNFGTIQLKSNLPTQAIQSFQRALPELTTALNSNLDHPDYSLVAKKACHNLVNAYFATNQYEQVLEQIEALIRDDRQFPASLWLGALLLNETRQKQGSSRPADSHLGDLSVLLLDRLRNTNPEFQQKPEFARLGNNNESPE